MLLDAVWKTIVACLTDDDPPVHITLPVDVKYQVIDEARFVGWAYKIGRDGALWKVDGDKKDAPPPLATLWDIPVTFENVPVGSVRTEHGDTRVVRT